MKRLILLSLLLVAISATGWAELRSIPSLMEEAKSPEPVTLVVSRLENNYDPNEVWREWEEELSPWWWWLWK